MLHTLRSWFMLPLLVVCAGILACGGDDQIGEAVHFQKADAELISTAMSPGMVRPGLTPGSIAFYGPANSDEKVNSLFLQLGTEGDQVWVSVEVYDVNARENHALDSTTHGRLTVLLGDACDGGKGDLLGAGCRWYSSDFYHSDCSLMIDKANRKAVSGRVVCGALGANCPGGTGIRSSAGTCLDGERLEAISVSLRFALSEPIESSKLTQARD